MTKVFWTGVSGKKYETELYEIGTAFYKVGGVYIFCKAAANNRWTQIYVGESEDLNDRLNTKIEQHHQIQCIRREGATHICAMVVSGGKDARVTVETDLRKNLDPPCNRQ